SIKLVDVSESVDQQGASRQRTRVDLIKMHRLASIRACCSVSISMTRKGRDVSHCSGMAIEKPKSSAIDWSSGTRKSGWL
ncbi:unnamed protein product, partial [Mycena citricolor]